MGTYEYIIIHLSMFPMLVLGHLNRSVITYKKNKNHTKPLGLLCSLFLVLCFSVLVIQICLFCDDQGCKCDMLYILATSYVAVNRLCFSLVPLNRWQAEKLF